MPTTTASKRKAHSTPTRVKNRSSRHSMARSLNALTKRNKTLRRTLNPFQTMMNAVNRVFKSRTQKDKYYRINVSIECFFFFDSILKKIDVNSNNKSPDELVELIIRHIMKKSKSRHLSIVSGGGGKKIFFTFIKILLYIAFYGHVLISLIYGTEKCLNTSTVRAVQSNMVRYYSKDTKCQRIDLNTEYVYLSNFVNYFLESNNSFTQVERGILNRAMEEVYSIYMCDEYSHVGKDDVVYCKDKHSKGCVLVNNLPTTLIPTEIINTAKQVDEYLRSYFHVTDSPIKDVQKDLTLILNDMDTCRTSMLTPMWTLIFGSDMFRRVDSYVSHFTK